MKSIFSALYITFFLNVLVSAQQQCVETTISLNMADFDLTYESFDSDVDTGFSGVTTTYMYVYTTSQILYGVTNELGNVELYIDTISFTETTETFLPWFGDSSTTTTITQEPNRIETCAESLLDWTFVWGSAPGYSWESGTISLELDGAEVHSERVNETGTKPLL